MQVEQVGTHRATEVTGDAHASARADVTAPRKAAEPASAPRVEPTQETVEREAAAREKAQAQAAHADRVVQLVNEMAERMNVGVLFRKSDVAGQTILEVVNRETGEVIRQVPAEEMLRRMERFSNLEGLITSAESR